MQHSHQMKNPKNILPYFIVLEIILGILFGYLYINTRGDSHRSLNESILLFYFTINGIFFGTTLIVGIACSIIIKSTDSIFSSVFGSILVGLTFLLIHAFIFSTGPFVFFSLFGHIIGFNYYQIKELNKRHPNYGT